MSVDSRRHVASLGLQANNGTGQQLAAAQRQHPAFAHRPLLEWIDLWPATSPVATPSVTDLPHQTFTTSGRAALALALRHAQLPAHGVVLVPSYHCPSIVAAVEWAGLQPAFYPLRDDGRPSLEQLQQVADTVPVVAAIVPHWFGLPLDLAEVRAWCNRSSVVLVEDCAHTLHGHAGDRPIGQWGDYAVASLTKFAPVAACGLLASSTRALPALPRPRAAAAARDAWTVLDLAVHHGRLRALRPLMSAVHLLRSRPVVNMDAQPQATGEPAWPAADMGDVDRAPSWVNRWLAVRRAVAHSIERRRSNFARLHQALGSATAEQRAASWRLPEGAAPYAYPLWIGDDKRADLVYAGMRRAGLPVCRWDVVHPRTPDWRCDTGHAWQRQLIQMLCHASLSNADVDRMTTTTLALLQRPA